MTSSENMTTVPANLESTEMAAGTQDHIEALATKDALKANENGRTSQKSDAATDESFEAPKDKKPEDGDQPAADEQKVSSDA